MTLLYSVFPPHIYIAICVASWGLIASLQSIAPSFESMFVLRALLGISEAAFGPGVPFFLSFFFRREELAFRTGLFISAAPLATSFASTLAWAIMKSGERVPVAGWRLLFLVEGFPSLVVAIFAFYQIPDGPGTAPYLSKRERKIAVLRLRHEKVQTNSSEKERAPGLQWREIWKALIDPKCYLTSVSSPTTPFRSLSDTRLLQFMFFSCNVAFSSLPPFLPTIIKEYDSLFLYQSYDFPTSTFPFDLDNNQSSIS